MEQSVNLVEVWRGPFLECVHRGDAVVCNAKGEVMAAWGNPAKTILPRSSCKMLQALPLIESGAAAKVGLNSKHLALSCASHEGAVIHVDAVTEWLTELGMTESDLRCGVQETSDKVYRAEMIKAGKCADQRHNNCSGKHSGFLTLNRHLGGGTEYVEPDHVVQKSIRTAFEEMCGETSQGYGIDGCSAPNFTTSLLGFATALARMADPSGLGAMRSAAAKQLVEAMALHPELVAGEGRACTELMRSMGNGTVVKTGADGVFAAILPERGLGVALKIEDGATRGSESAIAALLVRLGVADANDPLVQKRLSPVQKNWRGIETGQIKPVDGFFQSGKAI